MAHGPGAVRALNATTSGDLTFEDPATDFERFDRLPPELRFRLATNNTKAAAGAFEAHAAWCRQRGIGAARTIARVNELEANELAVFAGQYRGRYKTVLPHLGAEVSIQRYGALGPSKYPPRSFGRDIYRVPPGPRRRRRRGTA